MLDSLLGLESLGHNRFQNKCHQENFRQALFGGQVIAQALAAAHATVQDRAPHSLHAYFLRPGTTRAPVIYEVIEVRTGKTVSNREVIATQNGAQILRMLCSFHTSESGYQHQLVHPAQGTLKPEILQAREDLQTLPNEQTISECIGQVPLDYIAYDDLLFSARRNSHASTKFWIKSKSPLAVPASNYAALAFASDIGLLASALLPHDTFLFSGDVFPASMDHAMWFHQAPQIDHWHQYETESLWASGARALCSGRIFDQSGTLVATVMQEGLIRPL